LRDIVWTNTNKLLNNEFCGLKTGITKTAGSCLSAVYKPEDDYEYEKTLIIIVLNCKNLDDRFMDT